MKRPVPQAEAVGTPVAGVATSIAVGARDWRHGSSAQVADTVACELPVALVYNGISHVVMMATPADLEEFALGFSLTEGILDHPRELYDLEVLPQADGIEVAMTIAAERLAALKAVRRNLTGRTGCGLCGAESLHQAVRKPAPVAGDFRIDHTAIERAVGQLSEHQPLQAHTGAVHGAAWCDAAGEILALREDVGRQPLLGPALRRDVRDRPQRRVVDLGFRAGAQARRRRAEEPSVRQIAADQSRRRAVRRGARGDGVEAGDGVGHTHC